MSNESAAREVRVWDAFVRVFHWALALAFAVAFVTEDDALGLHVWAGYVVGGLVVARIGWGFIGPRRARFADFVCPPSVALAYLGGLVLLRARRYLGHSPAGGMMVVAMLAVLLATVATGLVAYGADRRAGPLGAMFAAGAAGEARGRLVALARADEDDDDEAEAGGALGEAMEGLHEFLADVALALVVAHIAGVILASLVHRENLTKAMITGRKRA